MVVDSGGLGLAEVSLASLIAGFTIEGNGKSEPCD